MTAATVLPTSPATAATAVSSGDVPPAPVPAALRPLLQLIRLSRRVFFFPERPLLPHGTYWVCRRVKFGFAWCRGWCVWCWAGAVHLFRIRAMVLVWVERESGPIVILAIVSAERSMRRLATRFCWWKCVGPINLVFHEENPLERPISVFRCPTCTLARNQFLCVPLHHTPRKQSILLDHSGVHSFHRLCFAFSDVGCSLLATRLPATVMVLPPGPLPRGMPQSGVGVSIRFISSDFPAISPRTAAEAACSKFRFPPTAIRGGPSESGFRLISIDVVPPEVSDF